MKYLVGLFTVITLYAQPAGVAYRVIRGSGIPSAGTCASLSDVSKVYVRYDAGAASSSLYVCANTGVATYAWELAGGGSTSVNVNGSSVSSPNLNATTPAAEAGYTNVKFQVSGSSVSGEIPLAGLPSGCTDTGASGISCTGAIFGSNLPNLPTVTRTSNTRLTIGANCSSSAPCKWNTAEYVTSMTAAATVDITGAETGAFFIYATYAGTLTVGHNLTDSNVTCSAGCAKAASVTNYPANTKPIWRWAIGSGTFDPTGTDDRSVLGIKKVVGSTGTLTSDSGGVTTISVDTATIATVVDAKLGITATAGAGGVTQNLLAGKDTSNPTAYIIPAAGGCGSGVAATTATVGNTFDLQSVHGMIYTMVADGAITAGHLLTGATSNPGRVVDTGQTSLAAVSYAMCIVGTAQANATAGNTVAVKYQPDRGTKNPQSAPPTFNYQGNGIAITGLGDMSRPFDQGGTLTGWALNSSASCSVSFDLCIASSYAIPSSCTGAGSLFNGGTVPALSSATNATATGLSITIPAGSNLRPNFSTNTCTGSVQLVLTVQ